MKVENRNKMEFQLSADEGRIFKLLAEFRDLQNFVIAEKRAKILFYSHQLALQ